MASFRASFFILSSCVALAACGDDGKADTESASSTTQTTPGTTSTTATGSTTDDPTGSGPTTGEPTTDGPTTGTTDGPTTGTTSPTDGSTTDMPPPACPYTPVDGTPGFAVQVLATGFDRPMLAVPDPTDPDRLFVVEQGGRVKILEPGMNTAPDANFMDLDVKNKVPGEIGPEQGLLGFAFHPDFPNDPRVYVNYNPAQNGAAPTVVSEFKLDANDPNKVDMASEREVIIIDQPASNHNGGMIAFGPDGFLYIGMGDGGGSNDQFNTGRDPQSLLSKLLRIDVEPDGQPDSNKACDACDMVDGFDYTVPADNPFVGDNDVAPEVWALGFRNPWRFFFDPPTGTLYTADVGQNQFEEIDIVSKGADYGWSDMEGNHCFQGAPCDESAGPNQANGDGLVAPIIEYDHNDGCSVTGGAVYHSCEVPGWDGIYFYGDYCSGTVWALRWDGTNVMDLGEALTQDDRILGYGYTGHGDALFTVVQLNEFNEPVDGKILRIAPQ